MDMESILNAWYLCVELQPFPAMIETLLATAAAIVLLIWVLVMWPSKNRES